MATILELAELSNAAYGGTIPPGWSVLTTSANSPPILAAQYASNGYYGAAYQNTATGEIVIANRGTRGFSSLTDLLSDLKLGLGGTPAVETDAATFALSIANNPLYSGKPIIETGHSLGGAEAQAAVASLVDNNILPASEVSAVTFNSPGISSGLFTGSATSYDVLNLYDQGDAIHLAGGVHLGSYGQNGLVMMPAGPNTSSLAWGTPVAATVGPVGIAALLGAALYDVLLPAHSLPNTIIPYLNLSGQGSLLGSTDWTAAGPSSPITIAGTGSTTGPTMSVNTAGDLVLTDASGNTVTLSASADQRNVNAIFGGGSSPVFQQLAAMGMVSIPVTELSQAVTNLAGASTINETITRNPNIADTFDVAFQNTGAPDSGDQFKVTANNPGSVFNYVAPTNGQAVIETIDNGSTNTSGTVSVITGTSNTQLTGGTPVTGTGDTWTDSNGDHYQFSADVIDSNIGTLTISKGLLGSSGADQIVIQNFDMNAAQNGGYLGIKFGEQLAIVAGVNPTSPFANAIPSSQTTNVPTGNTQTFTLYASAASTIDQTVTLALSGGSGSYAISTGANLLSLTSPVNITIPAGQDSVTLTLVDLGNTNTADTANLTATLTDASGTVTSNTLAVTFASPNPNVAGTAANTLNGDQTPTQYTDSNGITYYKTDINGNLITGGPSDPNFNDVLYGDGKNDVINTGGGINIVNGMGGNDTINGGPGNDIILSGDMNPGNQVPGNVTYTGAQIGLDPTLNSYTNNQNYLVKTNDVINGGGGQDVIIVGNGNNQIYANTQIDLATALTNQATATASGQKGDLIAVGDGNNTIVGGSGNDAIFTGTGNNTLVLGAGSVTVQGGVDINSASLSWYTSLDAAGTTIFNNVGGQNAPFTPSGAYSGSTFGGIPVGMGNDTIYGGSGASTYWLSNGNNWLDAGGGNDYIQAGVGSNTIFGGIGNDTIFGGGGRNYIDLESGSDTVVLNGGNQTVIGGTGNNYIVSGDNTSSWATSDTSSTNYILGGSGNTTIFGSGGNDTLISGSESGTGKSTIIYAGDGKEYIVGGNGSDSILGGGGSDTIYAGDGNTIIQLSSNANETSTVYGGMGSDSIAGGAGFDVISAGDGGTTNAPTYVYAGSGISTLYGGAGVDYLVGSQSSTSNDMMVAGTGTSTLQGGSGTEVMYSSIGNATLIAGTGSDTLYGGGGTDVLQGSSGNTLFVAGSGNETIRGGSGSNTYEFDAGFGNVELGNTQSADTFRFGAGISLADLTVSATIGSDGSSALLIQTSGGGQLTIDNGLNGAISQFAFANGTTLTLNQLLALANTTPATVAGANGNLIFSAYGNEALNGGAGNDSIYGWNGNDTLTAGAGNQALYSQTGSDLVTGGSGNDTLVSAAGHDTLVGGTGNTTFVVNSATNVIQAQSTGSNTNTLMSSVSYVAPVNVQNLSGTGSADLTLTGNSLSNTITANCGNDTLIAGSGIATMAGGTGSDTFVVNNVNDLVQALSSNNNINTIQTSVNYAAAANVLHLTGAGSADLTLTGNNLGNTITANSGNDTLIAGSGMATLFGGVGNDTFIVNNSADVVRALSSGSDTVQTSVDYTAPANVKNLTGTGSVDIALTGNNLGDVITANSGNDTLAGGAGSDTLIGGAGLDTFAMGYGMGRDTVIDASLQGGVIRLGQDVALSDLMATQHGNDLLLQIDSNDSMLIQGYYANPQAAWTIQDASGNSTTPQTIINNIANQSTITQLENSWISQAKANIIDSAISSGTFYAPPGAPGSTIPLNGANNSWIDAYYGTTVQTSFAGTPNQTTTTYSQGGIDNLPFDPALNSSYIPLGLTTVTVNGVTLGQGPSEEWLAVNWDIQSSTTSTSQQGDTTTTITSQHAYGYGASVTLTDPGATSFVDPKYIPILFQQNNIIVNQTFLDGTGQVVQSESTSEVNSSTGNDTIYNAGFVYTGSGNDTVVNAGIVYAGSGNNDIENAGTAYGGTGNDTMTGGGTLVAGSGNDLLMYGNTMTAGAGYDTLIGGNTLIAGSGNDQIFAGQGNTTIQIDPNLISSDLVGGAGGSNSSQFLKAVYQSMGIRDWQGSYQYATLYQAQGEAGKGFYTDSQSALAALNAMGFDLASTQDAITQGLLAYYPPLPVVFDAIDPYGLQPSPYYAANNVPVENLPVYANDFQGLAPYYAQGLLPAHTIAFGAGISASDLKLSWGQTMGSISGLASDPQSEYATLDISWGTGGQSIQVMIPHFNDPLGAGVSGFTFADGATLDMAQMIAMAPPAPSFDPGLFVFQPGMGTQTVGSSYSNIMFGAGITPGMITLGLGSLMLRVGATGDAIHITNFDPSNALAPNSIQDFYFADGTVLTYDQMLAKGFDIYGTTGDQTLSGTNLVNRIYAGSGNDTLIGTGASDLLVAGAGVDTLIGGTGNETFVINNAADVIVVNPNAANNTIESSISYVLPSDVKNLTLIGSADLTATGNDRNDVIAANAGNDTLIGGSGSDTFVLNQNGGHQTIIDSLKANGDVIRFGAGITAGNTQFFQQGADLLVDYGTQGNSALIKNFAPNGVTGNQVITQFQFADGSKGTYTTDGQGNSRMNAYDANGNLVGDFWQTSVGSYGNDTYNADGSSSGSGYSPDGSYYTYTQDSAGDYFERDYSSSGNLASDYWNKADGSYGSDTFNTGGSSSGTVHNADGSYSSYTNDGHGDVTTDYFDTSGTETAYSTLVSCHASNVGYSHLSLIRASSAVNCQFTLARI